MHKNRGKTVAQCLHDRTAYALNPDKTNGGELVSAYQCNPQIADAEFLLKERVNCPIRAKKSSAETLG